MKIIRGLHHLKNAKPCAIATIGNFDGVHLGHQAIILQLQALKKQHGHGPLTVILFEPQPREFFSKESAPARLLTLRDKLEQCKALGVQQTIILKFNRELAQLSPTSFIETILVKQLAVKHLVVGEDFHFGRNRQGSFQSLSEVQSHYGYSLHVAATQKYQQRRISSTWVREALHKGDFALAKTLLGRDYTMQGRVMFGEQLGRSLGVPTANIAIKRLRPPCRGVFVVKAVWQGREYPAVANVGNRPTVNGLRTQLEVHLLDFSGDLYGRHLTIVFLHKLRDEMRFNGLEALKAQLHDDMAQATHFFKRQ